MDINLIEYFGIALKENEVLSRDKQNELLKLATKTGYIVHPDCYNGSVLKFLRTKDVNFNSTFYKTWEDVTKRNRFQLLIDQLTSYIINYGLDGNFNMNDGDYSLVPDIRKYKCILPITQDDLFVKCRDVLYSGIALKDATSSALCGFVCKHYKEYVKRGMFSVDFVKNKESQVKICDRLGIHPNDKFNLLRFMVYKATGVSTLIKNKQTIRIISDYAHERFDMSKLSKQNIEDLSSIFYRFKPLFLAFKKQSKKNGPIVNKLRKLAEVNHRPFTTGFWEDVVNRPVALETLKNRLETDKPSNFKIITILQAIRENRLLFGAQSRYKMYIIRNGSVWIDKLGEPDVIDTRYDWWDILEDVLYRVLVDSLKEKACTVKFPENLSLTCPTSEKNFVGNIPFGSHYKMTKHNMFGIYWKNEWGTRDFDLSFTTYSGTKYGWNSRYYSDSDDKNVIYSGDMTNADPEASEVMYCREGCPNGIVKVNRYNGTPGSRYIFSVAQSDVQSLPRNYMMDPNTIKFQVEVQSIDKMEQMVGFINDNEIYMCTFNTANLRVSSAGHDMEDMAEIINRKCRSFVDLKQLLLDAGFKERKRGTKENPIELDLTDLKKDTLIELFS